MRRLILIAVAAFLLTACDNPNQPYAAKINDTVISTDLIDDEIEAVLSNAGSAEGLNTQLQASGGLRSGGPNTINSEYTSNVLYTRILATLFDREIKRLNIQVTPEQFQRADASLREQPGQSEIVDSFPESYRKYLIDRQAQLEALVDFRASPQVIADYYEKNKSSFEQSCVRHILVQTENEATAARAEIVGGKEFGALAGEIAVKQGEPANGGDLGCYTNEQLTQLVKPFADAVRTLPVNELSQVVKTQFGFHVIQVTNRKTVSLEEATPQIKQTVSSPQQLLNDLFKDVDIEVNPRYGDFKPGDPATGQPGQIVPHQSTGLKPFEPAPAGGSDPNGFLGTPSPQ